MPLATSTILLISAGVAAFGSLQQAEAVSDQAKFSASVSLQQAQREREIAAAEEADFRSAQSREMGSRRARMGARGVEQATGSNLLATGDFAAEVELQALRIRAGGDTRAQRLEQEAKLTRKAGRAARQRGLFRAGASLLTGFAEAGPVRVTGPSTSPGGRGNRP